MYQYDSLPILMPGNDCWVSKLFHGEILQKV